MTDYTVTKDWPDTITFDRLHALAKRGYRAVLGIDCNDQGFSKIELSHPRSRGKNIPPKITLWSNGIVATNELLWPCRHVPQEDGFEPAWQKYIDVTDREVFQSFVDSVDAPTIIDLYVLPAAFQFRIFLARLMLASSFCFCIAATIVLAEHLSV